MSLILSVEDMRKKAKARVPRMFFDYAESGSWTEDTLRANINDLMDIKFRQQSLV